MPFIFIISTLHQLLGIRDKLDIWWPFIAEKLELVEDIDYIRYEHLDKVLYILNIESAVKVVDASKGKNKKSVVGFVDMMKKQLSA